MPRPLFANTQNEYMIRIKEIQKAFSGLVGWRQPYASQQAQCSESGLYYQDAHPLLTLENMRSVMPGDWERQYPEWEKAKAYKQGDKVAYAPQIWIATADNTGQLPEQGSAYWQPFDTLTDYLGTLTESGTAAVVQTFLQMKQLQEQTRNLLERRTFFDGAGRIKATLQNRHKVAGFEIVPVRSMGVTAKIERVGLQMYGGTGDVTLYLFHSSQPEPVKTYTLPFTATNGGFQWSELEDCYLPYVGDGTNAGGAWYLCYDQDSLPLGMEAVNMSKDWSREPCGTCNAGDVGAWRELTKYLQISPFMVASPQGFRDNPLLWDISGNIYTNTANYGLNCMVTVGCDLTGFIISQRQAFATVLQRQVAATALRTLALNPEVRVNRNQSNATRDELLYELDGNPQGRPAGINYQLQQAYKALSVDTSGLDRVCLRCGGGGVKYRTV